MGSIRGASMGENMFKKTIKKKKGHTKLPTSASFVVAVHAVCAVAVHWGRVVVCVGVASLFALGSRCHPHRHRVAACAGVASSPLALGCVAVRAGVALPFALVCRRSCLCVTIHTSVASRSTPALRRRLRPCRVVVCTLVSRRSRSCRVVTCAGVASLLARIARCYGVLSVRLRRSGWVVGPRCWSLGWHLEVGCS